MEEQGLKSRVSKSSGLMRQDRLLTNAHRENTMPMQQNALRWLGWQYP